MIEDEAPQPTRRRRAPSRARASGEPRAAAAVEEQQGVDIVSEAEGVPPPDAVEATPPSRSTTRRRTSRRAAKDEPSPVLASEPEPADAGSAATLDAASPVEPADRTAPTPAFSTFSSFETRAVRPPVPAPVPAAGLTESLAPPLEETPPETMPEPDAGPVADDAAAAEPAAPRSRSRGRRGRGRGRRGAGADQATDADLEAVLEGSPAEPGAAQNGQSATTAPAGGSAAPVSEGHVGIGEEPGTEPESEVAETEQAEAPKRSRGRSRAAESVIQVNVSVPRGMSRRINTKLIDQVVQAALRREGWQTPASLDVHMVDDEEMQQINATRRGIDEATDVLSFPLLDLVPGQGVTQDFFVLPPEEVTHLGDVVISFLRVESQADEAGHSRERELAFLTVHAVLHILGYDHDTDERRRQMRRREEEVLAELGLRRNGS